MALSANLLLPLSQETAAKRGILPSLASRATIEFPNYTALNTRLSQLYGASVHSSVRKLGDYQVFGLAASGISSRYAFGGENMAEELCRILASMLFHPLLDKDGEFPEENFSQEKRQLLELKDAVTAPNFSEQVLPLLPVYLVGVVVSAVVGYFAIRLVKSLADKGKFGNFAYYCWAVGAVSLIAGILKFVIFA